MLDQMVLYDGDNTYKGKPLFRGAISMYPAANIREIGHLLTLGAK